MAAPNVFPPPIDPIDIDPGVAYQYVIPSQGETSLGFYGNDSFDLSLNGRVLTLKFTNALPAQTTGYPITVYASNADGITKQIVNFRINVGNGWLANSRFAFSSSVLFPGNHNFAFAGAIAGFLDVGDQIVVAPNPQNTIDPIQGKTFYVVSVNASANTFQIAATPGGTPVTPSFANYVFSGPWSASVSPINSGAGASQTPGSYTGGFFSSISPTAANQATFLGAAATFQFAALSPDDYSQNHQFRLLITNASDNSTVFDSGWGAFIALGTAPAPINVTDLPTDGRQLIVAGEIQNPQGNVNSSPITFTAYSGSGGGGAKCWVGNTSDLSPNDPVAIVFTDGRTIPPDLAGTLYIANIFDANHVSLSRTPGGATIVPAESLSEDPAGSDLLVLYRLKRRFAAIISDAETDLNPSATVDYKPTSDIAVGSWEAQDLPSGLSLNPATGEITGTASSDANYFTVALGAVIGNSVSWRWWILKVGTPTVVAPPGGSGGAPSLLLPIVDLIFDVATRRVYDIDGARANCLEVVLGDRPLLFGFRRFNVDDVLPDASQLQIAVKPRGKFSAPILIGSMVTVSGDTPVANCHENWASQNLFDLFAPSPDMPYVDLLGQIAYRLKSDPADYWRNSKPIAIRLWNSAFATALPDSGGGGFGSLLGSIDNSGVLPVHLPNNGVFTLTNIPLAHPYIDNHYALPAQLYSSDIDVRYKIDVVKSNDRFDLTITCKDAIAPNAGPTRYVDALFDWYTHEYAPVDSGTGGSPYSPSKAVAAAAPAAQPTSQSDSGQSGSDSDVMLVLVPDLSFVQNLSLGSGVLVNINSNSPPMPYVIRLASGSVLPAGLTIDTEGILHGIPTTVGETTIFLDGLTNGVLTRIYELTIQITPEPPPSYIGPNPITLPVNQAASQAIDLEYADNIVLAPGSGPLPPGVSILGFVLVGTPTTVGIYGCEFTASGSGGITNFNINIIVSV